jgi:hypothetical protein
MRNSFQILPILFLCYSCNFEIYVNGHKDHRIDKSFSYKKSNNDSCIIFGINDVIPDSSVLVTLIKIKYGDLADSVGIYSPYYSLLELAKEEAGLTGANIIKIVSYKKPMHFKRAYLTFRFYKLKEPYLTSYRRALDSSNAPNKTICLIHIRNCRYQESNLPIYFNDSLIGHSHNTEVSDESLDSSTKIKLTSNFKLYSDGKLSIKSSLRRFPIKDFLVEKNNEYFIKISDAYRSGTPYFMLVTKYDFY